MPAESARRPPVCRRCGGDGVVDHPDTAHLHTHDPAKRESIDCPACGGDGIYHPRSTR